MNSVTAPITWRRWLSVCLLLFIALWFGTLEVRDLIRTDETRYAEIPREMVASGDWITPRLSDLKYFEKPPLQYWATAAAFTAFGPAAWTARLWTALTGALAIWLTWFTLRRLTSSTTTPNLAGTASAIPWLGAGMLASSLFWIGGGHINSLDMGLSFFMHATLCCLLLALHADHTHAPLQARRWMLASWASMALAVMSKGLIGIVLPGGVLVVYILLTRDWRCLRRLEWLRGLALFFAITAPWFILVSLRNPEFPEFFFIHEHFQRFVSKGHRREGPPWYFIPILLAGLLPWTSWLFKALWQGVCQLLPALKRPQAMPFEQRQTLLLWLWVGLIFVFFSVSSSKLPGYILPIFPALCMLLAPQLAATANRSLRWHALAVTVVTGIFAAAIALLYPQQINKDLFYRDLYWQYAEILLLCLGLLVTASAITAWLAHRHRQQPQPSWSAYLLLGLASFVAGHGILLGHQVLSPSSSARVMAQTLSPYLETDTPLYSVDIFEHGLLFYTQRPAILVATKDEMYLGVAQEPHKQIPDLAQFAQRWQQEKKAIALVKPDRLPELTALGVKFDIRYQDQRRILISKPLTSPTQ
ncbi:glycosyltransferase family 39 protein [Parvibium lacunae]|uniref:Glycosyltransferase family 39 protein n=1 Tax=Parvibium lacunae TaxID=1888893 RepID=A0A368L6T2_9BURK|nr:glycosyltransferase family 39 protein [Parvibium lacunae]RCS59398.1 glycosyltransferase family 39 protein [Parvibium lacunae]